MASGKGCLGNLLQTHEKEQKMHLIATRKHIFTTLTFIALSAGVSSAHTAPSDQPIKILKMTEKLSSIEVVLDTSHTEVGYFECLAYGSDGIPFASTKNISGPRATIVTINSFDIPSVYSVECYPF